MGMKFRSTRHKRAFMQAVGTVSDRHELFAAALYLLTADAKVWKVMKSRIRDGDIHFEQVRFDSISESGYALFCAAKDLYLGTQLLSIADMADDDLISPRAYATICYAIAIGRGIKRLPEESAGQAGSKEKGGRRKIGKTPATKIQEEED